MQNIGDASLPGEMERTWWLLQLSNHLNRGERAVKMEKSNNTLKRFDRGDFLLAIAGTGVLAPVLATIMLKVKRQELFCRGWQRILESVLRYGSSILLICAMFLLIYTIVRTIGTRSLRATAWLFATVGGMAGVGIIYQLASTYLLG